MTYDEIKTFEQDEKDATYEDELYQYFKLHYKLINVRFEELEIGCLYYWIREGVHIAITHQIKDTVYYTGVIYDINGNLIHSGITGGASIKDLHDTSKFTEIGSYDILMKSRERRIKIGLEYEKKVLERKLKFIDNELENKYSHMG